MCVSLDADAVRAYYRVLDHPPGTFTEFRALDPRGKGFDRPHIHWPESEDALVRYCEMYAGQYQLYLGVQPRRERPPGFNQGADETLVHSVRTLAFDIDAIRPEAFKGGPATIDELFRADWIADQIESLLMSRFQAVPVWVCSGNGFQLLVPIEPIPITKDTDLALLAETLATFWKWVRWNVFGTPYDGQWPLPDMMRWVDVDGRMEYHDLGPVYENGVVDNTWDLPRIMRVAGTPNVKGSETEDRVHRQASIRPRPRVPSARVTEFITGYLMDNVRMMREWEAAQKAEAKADAVTRQREYRGYDGLRPCFRRALEDGVSMTGEEGHHARVALVGEANAEGMSEFEICSLFTGQADYDAKTTRYQVHHAVRKGYGPWTCATLQRDCGRIYSQYCYDCPIDKKRRG